MVKHLAFTMIELIFAIVIIAFAVLSLPMINNVIAKNIEGSMSQEAIFAASAELNQVVSLYWDELSMEGAATLSRVVWTSATDCNLTTKRRSGHINQPLHRRCRDSNTPPTIVGDTTLNSLNDISRTSHNIFIDTTKSASGYKQKYTSTFTVAFANFGTITSGNKNIKKITVLIKDKDAKEITKLSTFSANIGEIDYHDKDY